MNINELREEYFSIHKSAGDLNALVATEKRTMTAEEKESQEKRYARMDSINETIAEQKKLAAHAFSHGEIETVEPKGKAAVEKKFNFSQEDKRQIVNDALRFGGMTEDLRDVLLSEATTPEEKYTIISTTSSSVLLPKSLATPLTVRRLNNSFRAALAAFNYLPIEGASTEQITVPVFDDTANVGDAPAENASSDTAVDATISGSITLNATLFESKTQWFSNTQILSQSYDILGVAQPILQRRLDKIQESTWTTTLATKTTGMVTTASKTALTYAELLSWEHALAPAYRSDAVMIVSDGLFKIIRGMVDDQHRPIFDADPQGTFQGRLHGKPIIVNDYLGAFSVNQTVGAFISASAIVMRDVVPQRLLRYVNVPTYLDQTGLNLVANGDCGFVQSGVALLHSATS